MVNPVEMADLFNPRWAIRIERLIRLQNARGMDRLREIYSRDDVNVNGFLYEEPRFTGLMSAIHH